MPKNKKDEDAAPAVTSAVDPSPDTTFQRLETEDVSKFPEAERVERTTFKPLKTDKE
jgi:hypothetical protein